MGAVPVCAGCPGFYFCFCSLGRAPKRAAENDGGRLLQKAVVNGRSAHGAASGPLTVPSDLIHWSRASEPMTIV